MNLEKVEGCPTIEARDIQRVKDSLLRVAEGVYSAQLVTENLFTMKELVLLSKQDVDFGALFTEARAIGNEVRQIAREEAADQRAVDGVDRPIYTASGVYAGSERVYSDSLLALQLKAHDPQKYSGAGVHSGGGFVLNVNLGLERGLVEKSIEAECKEVVDGKAKAEES